MKLYEMEINFAEKEIKQSLRHIRINWVLQLVNFIAVILNVYGASYNPTFICGFCIGMSGTVLIALILENIREKRDLLFHTAKYNFYKQYADLSNAVLDDGKTL